MKSYPNVKHPTKTHIDLFSGIGGFALAARWAGLQTIQFVEIDPFCQKVLKKHWPEVPIHDDVTTFQWDGVRPFLLTGGFPCQPFSTAKHGKRGNVRDYSQTCIKVLSAIIPKYAIIENVDRRVIEEVASGLRNAGCGRGMGNDLYTQRDG